MPVWRMCPLIVMTAVLALVVSCSREATEAQAPRAPASSTRDLEGRVFRSFSSLLCYSAQITPVASTASRGALRRRSVPS